MDQRTLHYAGGMARSSAGAPEAAEPAHWGVHSPQRLQRERAAARRHSARVRLFKRLLPLASLLIVLGVVGTIAIRNLLPGFDLGAIGLTSDGIVMSNPELSGHDGQRSYKVSARRAVQSLTNPRLITLEDIDARVRLSPSEWVAFTAPQGIYDSGSEQLRLADGIKLQWSRGYDVTLSGADIDLKTGTILSDDAIRIVSEQGQFLAGRISVEDSGSSVRFTDGVRMTLHPAKLEKTQ